MNPYPLEFRPVLKQTIWGGRRLGEILGKPIGDADDYAESWEIVDHGEDQSVVSGGELDGKQLADLMTEHRDWLLGDRFQHDSMRFPLLLKYLDCNRVLSVQVHPDDEYGATLNVPDHGKTEAWYIVDSQPESLIYAGLKRGVDREILEAALAAGKAEQILHSFHPNPGDCIFIPAGTVHALGAGLLVAEIQQSSNTTFRLFDWNRLDPDGNPRDLHIQQSLDVADYESGPVAAVSSDQSANGWQKLVECDKFTMRTLENGSSTLGGDGRFHILTVPRGNAVLEMAGDQRTIAAGESLLLPAAMDEVGVRVNPDSTLLAMHAN